LPPVIAIEEPKVDDEALIRRIELASLWAWPPERTATVGGWLLRQGCTATRRQNSVQTLAFTSEIGLDRAIANVEEWYAVHARRAAFQVTPLTRPAGLASALRQHGYRTEGRSLVMTRTLDSTPLSSQQVTLEGRATAFVMEALSDPRQSSAERFARARLFGQIRRTSTFAVRAEGGVPAAGALCVVDAELAGIFALRTATWSRRRGHAKAIVARLLQWTRAMGAEQAYLQVEARNEAALALFRAAGFQNLYGYRYLARP
jgi:ribosomal protein S18 acetylase RimI-like enzyme